MISVIHRSKLVTRIKNNVRINYKIVFMEMSNPDHIYFKFNMTNNAGIEKLQKRIFALCAPVLVPKLLITAFVNVVSMPFQSLSEVLLSVPVTRNLSFSNQHLIQTCAKNVNTVS